MMNTGLLIITVTFTLCPILYLYFNDPYEFLERLSDRLFRITLWYNRHYGKIAKDNKNKYRTLRNLIDDCQESITKYIKRTNLRDLDKDVSLLKLLEFHKQLLSFEQDEYADFTVEKLNSYFEQIADFYDPFFEESENDFESKSA